VSAILQSVAGFPRRKFAAGEVALPQGGQSTQLLVLTDGEVEVLRDNVRVARAATPGAMFGEMSVLLNCPYTATVRTLRESTFAVVDQPRQFLASSSGVSLYVAELLAARLDALNKYLIDVKRQYEGHDHLGMVDEVLETLMNRPLRPAVAAAPPPEPRDP
jgi:CRP-like cAMP-binding protein